MKELLNEAVTESCVELDVVGCMGLFLDSHESVMATRSVHLSEKTEALIGFLSDEKRNGGKNYSDSINGGLSLLEQLMLQSRPNFSEEEWVYLCNVYSGCLIEFIMPISITSDIMDDLGIYDLAEIDGIGCVLIEKISTMSQCEKVAILWEVKMRWFSVKTVNNLKI